MSSVRLLVNSMYIDNLLAGGKDKKFMRISQIPVIRSYHDTQVKMVKRMDDLPLVSGKSFKSEVRARYDDLVRLFGDWNGSTDGYKVDAEWIVMTLYGVCTIYNYKDGKNYLGEEDGKEVYDITEWHLSGHTRDAVEVVRQFIMRDQSANNIIV